MCAGGKLCDVREVQILGNKKPIFALRGCPDFWSDEASQAFLWHRMDIVPEITQVVC